MIRPRLAHALVSLAALAMLSMQAPALAAPRLPEGPTTAGDIARERFSRGVALFQEGDHKAALVEFRRAYEALPNFRVQYNVARTCLELKDEACALGAFERYLAEGGGEIEPARHAEVERELERLRVRVGYVEVLVAPRGADVSIDDVPVGTAPLPAPLPVDAGRHRIVASTPAGLSTYRFVEIAGGERLHVELSLDTPKRPESTVARPIDMPDDRPPARSHTGLWVGLAVTSTLAVSAGALGYLAYREHGRFEHELNLPSLDIHHIERHRERGRTLSLVADLSTAAAISAGAVTLYVALRPEKAKTPASTGALKVLAGAQGVSLRYSF